MDTKAVSSFREPEAVREHLADILDFWLDARDERHGGYTSQVRSDTTVHDRSTRHLVASARFVVQFSLGALHDAGARFRNAAAEALEFLTRVHRDRRNGGYHWVLRVTDDGFEVADSRKQTYGHAFVLLAGATATSAGVPGGRELLDEARAICEEKLLGAQGLAVNTVSADWTEVSPYRGQNANMHLCEAFLAAYDATGDPGDLHRAYRIADAIARRIPTGIGGFVWENYREDWSPDWAEAPRDLGSVESAFGISPGHQVEWAKLLGILARHDPAEWLLPQAVHLHRLAWDHGWEREHGGFVSGLRRDLSVSHREPAYWAPAEAIGAAAVLQERTGDEGYRTYSDRAWEHALTHLVDHEHGGWFTAPAPRSERHDFRKGDAFEPDYHSAGACAETLRSRSGRIQLQGQVKGLDEEVPMRGAHHV
ncbi:AGE family epimerase/isomerase [Pseudonocardia sp. MH-G8]|uniref:AGE family epimerase/isomerase n=1 Tax=Pseudonocardia sp. MH-G8 TaxID=1854588 RepID=UPI0013044ED5|nr:AGE family epimerase/isomerase [Pseudonocardia sp. MH-G8]